MALNCIGLTVELETVPQGAEAPAPPAATRPQVGRALNILFVEDNPDTLRSLTRLLRSSRFLLDSASRMRAALAAADLAVARFGRIDRSRSPRSTQTRRFSSRV
jgi:hypothetical protein